MAVRWRGFTLVELMITVAVLAIVVTLAAPSFSDLINRNRLTAAANEVVGALQTARMEAVRRNTRVVLCPSTDGTSCSGADWQRLIAFSDADGDVTVDADDDEIIRDMTVSTGGIVVNPSSNTATNQRISFGASGLARVGAGVAREGGLSVCSDRLDAAENTRDVVVAVSRVSVTTRNGSDACSARTD
ncbi:GspH/FimT family pseudopilin [Lysobacter erysipheiresistens]|uniref:Type II secretion system protein H n=1 Tax=Novilysobacter erysipheiresistens TaxID=1749332 RepID=A0ABU7YTQ6_9GAMM